jgi:WD40 repeat protein
VRHRTLSQPHRGRKPLNATIHIHLHSHMDASVSPNNDVAQVSYDTANSPVSFVDSEDNIHDASPASFKLSASTANMHSDWRTGMGIVDLTSDSDHEDEAPSSTNTPSTLRQQVPLPRTSVPVPGTGRSSNASTSTATATARASYSQVPLPGSVPRSLLANTSRNAHASHSPIVFSPPTNLNRPPSAASASRTSYVPAPIDRYDGTNDSRGLGPPEKKRKISTPGEQLQAPAQGALRRSIPPTGIQTPNRSGQQRDGDRHGPSSAQSYHAQAGPAPSRLGTPHVPANTTTKAPSVHYMNAALKANGATTSLVDQVAKNEPRPLQIGRLPGSGTFEMPSPGLTTPGTTSTTPTDPVPPHLLGANVLQRQKSTQAQQRTQAKPRTSVQTSRHAQDNMKSGMSNIKMQQPHNPYLSAISSAQSDDDKDSVLSDVSLPTGQANIAPSAGSQGRIVPPAAHPDVSKFRLHQLSKAHSRGAVPSHLSDNRDSSIVDATLPAIRPGLGAPTTAATSSQHTTPISPLQPTIPPSTKRTGQFSEEEEHLLIFLKEVKKFGWKTITPEFNKFYPGRFYHTLQSRYSTKTNRRDRSLDPAVLKLPPQWAAEAVIDWASVHAENTGPRERVELPNLYRDLGNTIAYVPKPMIVRETTEQDSSSGTESGIRQQRARRAAPPVNYDVRRRIRQLGADLGDMEVDDVIAPSPDMDTPMRSESPSQALSAIPGKALVVINEPLDMHFRTEDADIGLLIRKNTLSASEQRLPYFKHASREMAEDPSQDWEWDQLTSREWQGSLIHVDFSPNEFEQVEKALARVCRSPQMSRHGTRRRHLRTLLKNLPEPKLMHLAQILRGKLTARDPCSIDAFLEDARDGAITDPPRILRLCAARPQKTTSSVFVESTTSMLRHRETGSRARRGWKAAATPVSYQTRNKLMDTLGPLSSWTGASSDIHTVAWSPDGEAFAAGAVAVTDRDSMQYNRPNNLLFGSLEDATIHELAEHNVERKKTDAGANSSHEMFVTQDPRLYTTVTSVAFAPSGRLMYSAGYDESVCVWHIDGAGTQPTLGAKLKHKSEVEMMVVNPHSPGTLATAAKRTSGAAIKLLTLDENDCSKFNKHNFHSEKAMSRSDLRILPQALQFEPKEGKLLLAGFGANVRVDDGFDLTGDLCLWDIETQTQMSIHGSNRNVFDIAFNPNRRYMPLFAAGCVAGSNVNRGTRSVIRLYDINAPNKYTCPLEIECRALDINDVTWCPQDEHLIAAGCTDGRVYIWDMRSPNDPLRVLSHGHSLMPLQDGLHHERTDTGIRFLSWGDNATRLYSGSSDGIVKVWDVTRSAEDTFIKDLVTLDSGIMAGSFSPDFTKLVLGEVNGSVNVLDVGRDDCAIKDTQKLRYVPYEGDMREQDPITGDLIDDTTPASGVAEGKYLVQTQQLQTVPMGNLPVRQVVQGPAYAGPFDQSVDAPYLREQALEFQLSMTATSGPQCDIASCKDNIVVTSEELGDSGRSSDRIPDELRRQWTAIDTTARIMPGKSKCTHCSRPARPATSDDPDTPVLCERCSFACFRCGAVNPIAPATTTLICDSCAGVWEIGALGYECVEQPAAKSLKLDVPPLRRFGRDMVVRRFDVTETSFGDEMNALTDYYHSLAIDRPKSPPL